MGEGAGSTIHTVHDITGTDRGQGVEVWSNHDRIAEIKVKLRELGAHVGSKRVLVGERRLFDIFTGDWSGVMEEANRCRAEQDCR